MAIILLLGGVGYIYFDGLETIRTERSDGLVQLEENLAVLEFVTKYKDFVHSDIHSESSLNKLYESYLAGFSAINFFTQKIPDLDFSDLAPSVERIKAIYLKKIEILNEEKKLYQEKEQAWSLVETTIGREVISRLDKRQEFMPGFKKTLSLWAKDIPLFEKLKENIDVSYVNKEKFNEIQSLVSLSQRLIELDHSKFSTSQEMDQKSQEFFRALDQSTLESVIKTQIRDETRHFLIAFEKLKAIQKKQDLLKKEITELTGRADEIVNEKIMPAWHLHMSGQYDQKLIKKNQNLKLVFDSMAIIGIFIIFFLLLIFLSLFPYLNKLEKKAREISEGRFEGRFEKIPNNEMGNVMRAFNEMSDKIVDYIERLKYEETNKLQLTESLQKFKRLNEMSEFSAKMSHEIKNPISILNFCLSDAIEYLNLNQPDKCLAELTKSEEALKRLKLISQRLGARSFTPAFESIHLNRLIDDLLGMYRSWLRNEKIQLKIQLPTQDIYFSGPRLELQSSISNLIDNAVESMRENTILKEQKIFVNLDFTNNEILISVSNYGDKIIDSDKIFHNFYSTKSGAQRGLGLSIVKDFVNLMKGELEYKYLDQKNHFLIRLPSPQMG